MSGAGVAGGPGPRGSNLGYWLSDACAGFPDRVALIDLSRPSPRERSRRFRWTLGRVRIR